MECESMEHATADRRCSSYDRSCMRLTAIELATGGKERCYNGQTWPQRRALLLHDCESKPAHVRKLVAEIVLKYGYDRGG